MSCQGVKSVFDLGFVGGAGACARTDVRKESVAECIGGAQTVQIGAHHQSIGRLRTLGSAPVEIE